MRMLFAAPAKPPPPSLLAKLAGFNWTLLILVTTLAGIGVAALYSVSGGDLQPWASKHVVRFCFGLGLLFIIALSEMRWWMHAAFPFYLVALVLLATVPFVGVESGGAKRWLGFGDQSFQPSELMKLALILALARYYQWLPPQKVSHPLWLLPPLIMVALPVGLALQQPDLGTAALFGVVGAGMLLLAGVSLVYFIAAIAGVIAALPVLWERLHDYQRERILTLFDPERDPLGSGYHIIQSKIAVGSGGLTGKGFMQGTQAQLDFLPEKHTDFIFTLVAEEMGFIGAVTLLTLYLCTLILITYMALRCRSVFARLVAAGVGLSLFAYVFINVAIVIGLIPVVGLPLPLLSYGGTAMLTTLVALGFVLNAHIHCTLRVRPEENGLFWPRRRRTPAA
jgi:rod shape determining protein RodA